MVTMYHPNNSSTGLVLAGCIMLIFPNNGEFLSIVVVFLAGFLLTGFLTLDESIRWLVATGQVGLNCSTMFYFRATL